MEIYQHQALDELSARVDRRRHALGGFRAERAGLVAKNPPQCFRIPGQCLANAWRDGALFGATAEEAFYVKCDEETNPKAVRDLGQVVTEIGVAIVNPAEFVVFRISQMAGN